MIAPRRALWPAALARWAMLALVLLPACRVDVEVSVEAEASGGGEVAVTVSLDKAAFVQVPDLAEQLRVEDLLDAGWRIEGPSPTAGGGATVRAAKRFDSPDGAALALRELSGDDGPFSSLQLERERTVLTTSSSLSGRIDLRDGLAAFSDPDLQERLGGLPVGVDPATLEREFGQPVADAFAFRVSVRLPGEPAEVVEARLGEVVPVSVSSRQWDLRRAVPAAISLSSFLALAIVLLRRRHRRE